MPTESEILQSLGLDTAQQQAILGGTAHLLILDASAHMDWDWLLPFPVLLVGANTGRAEWYFHPNEDPGTGPVVTILGNAEGLLEQTGYRYSVCETGFLRGFALANPAVFAELVANSNTFRSEGGGITSPDNLLPNGEAFIRNYLVGHVWLAANAPNVPKPVTVWIPDDFGHDPQLPVLAQAMGMIAAGFERLPGGGFGGDPSGPINGTQSLASRLMHDKIDFNWKAADGSCMVGHWLIGGYGQGNDIGVGSTIQSYLDTNFTVSPTPYIYVPVLSDFSLPNTHLLSSIQQWNSGGGAYDNTTVIAVAASFEDYAQLVSFHTSELHAPYGDQFDANPFWTGCSASRPELKIRHHRAARNLVAAEVFSVIASFVEPTGGTAASGTGATAAQNLFEGWDMLSPSTHHDYITGTAIPDVFHTEQTTLLRAADAQAEWLVTDAMETIAGAIGTEANPPGAPVAVFNPLGFARTGVVEISGQRIWDVNADVGRSRQGLQWTAEGNLLFYDSAPSLGYATTYLGPRPQFPNPATLTQSSDVYTLANGLVQATVQQDGNGHWALSSVIDLATNTELIKQGEVANDLQFWADGGDEYQLGNEVGAWTLTDVTSRLSRPSIQIVESGPLRATLRTTITYTDDNGTIDFIRDYILYANEPMLRFRSSGAAPLLEASNGNRGCCILVAFPFTSPIDRIVRGTPYHWTDLMPPVYWTDQTLLPTHDFVIAKSRDAVLGAIYHADIPGWGISNQWNGHAFEPNDGVLYGSLWRNGDAHYYGWTQAYYDGVPVPYPRLVRGSDPDVHVHQYALRMPSNLGDAKTAQPLCEALAFASPLRALPVAPWTGTMPLTLSLASTDNAAALITVVKPGTVNAGDVVLRVYQPTNAKLPVNVTLDSHLSGFTARGQTALEHDLDADAENALGIATTATTISFTAPYALTTLAVTPPAS